MNGDRERCLAAGMDGYLSKPIKAAEMFDAIASVTHELPPTGPDPASSSPHGGEADRVTAAVFDLRLALERCCQSQQMLVEIVACLFEEAERLFPQIHAALRLGNLQEVGRLGHRLKGTLLCLGAEPQPMPPRPWNGAEVVPRRRQKKR